MDEEYELRTRMGIKQRASRIRITSGEEAVDDVAGKD